MKQITMIAEKVNSQLPAIPEAGRMVAYSPSPFPDMEAEQPSIPLSHYLWILKRHRWKIVAFVIACVACTWVLSSRITPVYEATATVDVDRQTPSGIVGQEAQRTASANDADQFLATQVKLIQSDSVLRPVARKYKLQEHENQLTESATVNAVDAQEAPVLLKKLKVTRPPNTYLLQISYRSPDPHLAADVANGIANSYLEHTYNIRIRSSASLSSFMEKQLEELRAKMERSSQALAQFERELNVINPEEKTSILSTRLQQLNTEYTAAQADRVRKEAAFDSVRTGSLEAAQASAQGEALRKIVERLNEAREKFAEVRVHFGTNHPEYKKAQAQLAEVERLLDQTRLNIGQRVEVEYREAINREAMLKKAVAEIKTEFDKINARSFEYQALKREAEADKKLYEELVRKIKEAGINAGFQNSAIRIADLARPPIKAVFPNLQLNLILAFVFSTLISVVAAVMSDVLDNTVRDPEQVARTMKTEVIGSLPTVKNWKKRWALAAAEGSSGALVPLSEVEKSDQGFGEAIRTLRNSILLSDLDRRVKSILITSAAPGEGKSTTAVHLALAHAGQGQKTLLIDGDLRRPSVHRRMGISGQAGLSNVLLGEAGWKDVVVKIEGSNLEVLPAGPPSRRASDLVGPGMVQLLDEASRDYDLVVLDAPPLLGFAEPLQMATAVDGVVVVTRAGATNRNALNSVLGLLKRLRANVMGIVLNEVHKEVSNNYYYYGHYNKYYAAQTGD